MTARGRSMGCAGLGGSGDGVCRPRWDGVSTPIRTAWASGCARWHDGVLWWELCSPAGIWWLVGGRRWGGRHSTVGLLVEVGEAAGEAIHLAHI